MGRFKNLLGIITEGMVIFWLLATDRQLALVVGNSDVWGM